MHKLLYQVQNTTQSLHYSTAKASEPSPKALLGPCLLWKKLWKDFCTTDAIFKMREKEKKMMIDTSESEFLAALVTELMNCVLKNRQRYHI